MLSAKDISYSIGKKNILKDISAEFRPGEFNMILGPNGSGKSTFLKIISAEINEYAGTVLYEDKNARSIKKEMLAKYRAVMSQQPELSFPLTVEEVVMMGRYPHFNFSPGKNDEAICNEVIGRMNLQAFRQRNYLTLSGGEKQRVQYARVLAQIWEKPQEGYRYLFLDEPLSNLDISYQQEFLELAKEFALKHTVVIAVMHDINLAIEYAGQLFFFKEGALFVKGKPGEIITTELILNVYKVQTGIIQNPHSGKPLVLFSSGNY